MRDWCGQRGSTASRKGTARGPKGELFAVYGWVRQMASEMSREVEELRRSHHADEGDGVATCF